MSSGRNGATPWVMSSTSLVDWNMSSGRNGVDVRLNMKGESSRLEYELWPERSGWGYCWHS